MADDHANADRSASTAQHDERETATASDALPATTSQLHLDEQNGSTAPSAANGSTDDTTTAGAKDSTDDTVTTTAASSEDASSAAVKEIKQPQSKQSDGAQTSDEGDAHSWQRKAANKRAQLAASIPAKWRIPADKLPAQEVLDVSDFPSTSGLLTARELDITSTNLIPLCQKLQSGEWKAREVTEAFCHRAAIAHQLVNCLAEVFFDVAVASAEAADEYMRRNGRPIGPLHGVPVSLKDQFRVTGVETTMGYVAWIGKTEHRDSVLVNLLRKAGAILYVKTNVPQTLMLGETDNNIFGRTVNPYNRGLSCGGSSGGEGALLALRGSVIGIGTDIGGSIRIPAAFCKLYGLRPSHGRLPYALAANSMYGQETINSTCGPLGHSPEDLAYLTKAVLAQQPWLHDPAVVDLDWRSDKMLEATTNAKTFAYLETDGVVMPHPPIRRAIRETVEALTKAGHKVVPWKVYQPERAMELVRCIFNADAWQDVRKTLALSGEPMLEVFRQASLEQTPLTINELWDLQAERREYQREFLAHWAAQEHEHGGQIDGVIMPIAPHAAVRHGQYLYGHYTNLANLLDYPSVVVPVGEASPTLDPRDDSYAPVTELDKENWPNYDPAAYTRGPIAVQVMGRRLQEEYTLGLAQQIRFAHEGTSAAETTA